MRVNLEHTAKNMHYMLALYNRHFSRFSEADS